MTEPESGYVGTIINPAFVERVTFAPLSVKRIIPRGYGKTIRHKGQSKLMTRPMNRESRNDSTKGQHDK